MSPHDAFLRACEWDVAVRKPGNVSHLSPGHGMQAQQFLDSARACVDALCRRGAPVGERIEAAVADTWARVGCNTNLGIVLLCAPLAAAAEHVPDDPAPPGVRRRLLRAALHQTLTGLSVLDAAAAFRAIAMANPGGLGTASDQDVRMPPSVTLLDAMRMAAARDRIAAQYAEEGAELFELGLPALGPGPVDAAGVQRVYLAWLSSGMDSHIVRKQGLDVAQTVLHAARPWARRAGAGADPSVDPAFIEWDLALKRDRINPGTSADLTVATLMLAGLLA